MGGASSHLPLHPAVSPWPVPCHELSRSPGTAATVSRGGTSALKLGGALKSGGSPGAPSYSSNSREKMLRPKSVLYSAFIDAHDSDE
eukprot:1846158-Pleurochrysis_carterae.AAC.4